MIKGETKQVEFTMKRRGKQYVLKIGDVIAFRKGYGPKLCAIGRVTSAAVSEGVVHVHKYAPEIGGLRVKWCLLYLDQQGQESLAPEGGRPCIEEVKMSLLITKVELSRDGILQASSARKLDKGGYRLEERPPAQRDPERRGEHEYSEPLDDLVGILKGGKTESGVGVFAAGPSDGFAEEQKAVLEYLRNEGVPQHGVDFLEVFAGHGGLTKAARRRGLLVGEPVDRLYRSYGRDWDLRKNSDRALLAWLISKVMKPKVLHVGAPCEKLSRLGEQTPSSEDLALAEFSCDLLSHQEKANGIGTLENPAGSAGSEEGAEPRLHANAAAASPEAGASEAPPAKKAGAIEVRPIAPPASTATATASGSAAVPEEDDEIAPPPLPAPAEPPTGYVSLDDEESVEIEAEEQEPIKESVRASGTGESCGETEGHSAMEETGRTKMMTFGHILSRPARAAEDQQVNMFGAPRGGIESPRGPKLWKSLLQDSSDDVVTEDEDAFRQFSRKPKKRGGRRHPGKGDRKKRSRKKVRRQRWADQPLTGGVASTIGEDRAGGAGETLQAVPILDEVTSPGFSLSAERDDARGQSSGLVRDDFSSPLATSEGAVLYLQQVLNDIRKESKPPGSLRSDHLSRLNAAVFNLSGRGAVDSALALKVFQTVDKIHTAYNAEKYDNSDSAFFSNYLALLGTMQNQVFFSQKQNEKFVSWIKLAVDGSGKLVHLLDKALETENEKLRLQLSRLERSDEPSRSSTEPRSRAG
ncbi:unnamed protein product [Effrenium voratum]|uniref:Uncharacterized protein n=1 Tax=Effrenium voratum TaxID=2562239 RepID=A0AA36JDZ2_9DINO|nr:unnamed protein product [Effrenium voratum]